MKIFAWLTIAMALMFIFMILVIPHGFISAPAVMGWVLCLLWISSWATSRDRAEKAETLLRKAETQNNEFAADLIETLKKQAEEIRTLREEKMSLMLTFEELFKGRANDEKN